MLAAMVCCGLAGCSGGSAEEKAEGEKVRYQAEFLDLFDTATQIIFYAESEEAFNEFKELVYDNLKEYHELYDIYNDYEGISNIKTINDNAGIGPVMVDGKIMELLLFSKEASGISGGKVNVAFGPVLELWHDCRQTGINDPENAELPSMEALQAASEHTDINSVIIDKEASTVFLESPEMSLDVGAVAKGYAVEKVCDLLAEKGYDNCLISVGGNVKAIGGKGEEGLPWNVGIQNPDTDAEEASLYTLELKDQALVTSGDYQRYYTVDGKKYHHIIDPETLMPSDYFRAVTIVCEDSGMADALSTAVFNLPYEEGNTLVGLIDGAEAVWILKDGSVRFSENFQSLIHE